MESEKITKYHHRVFVGKSVGDKYGYKYTWNPAHPDLIPTSTFRLGYKYYCSYCCEPAYPIQSGLRDHGEDYNVTGHCCVCEGAEKEKEYNNELKKLREQHRREEENLLLKYKEFLKEDKRKRLTMEYEHKLKQLKDEYKYKLQ